MAKPKNNYVPTQEDIKRLRTQMSTRQPSATIGPVSPTLDPSKGGPPKYENNQKVYDALNFAGKVATEGVMIALGGGVLVRGATKLAAKGVGKYVGNLSTQAALQQNMKGLTNASGMGGKVSTTQTPFGPTLRSTKIGSAAEQSARVNNLTNMQVGRSVKTGSVAGRKAMIDVFKAGKKVKQGGAILGGAVVTGRNRPNK
jgi:hypothetical protein